MVTKCRNYLIAYIRQLDIDISCERGSDEVSELVTQFRQAQIQRLSRVRSLRNSGRKEGYFSRSVPHWKNVIGSTTNLLNLAGSGSNNHPMGHRWYFKGRSTILGIFHQIQIEHVSSFNYLIVTLFYNLLRMFLKSIRSDVWSQWVRRPNSRDKPQLEKTSHVQHHWITSWTKYAHLEVVDDSLVYGRSIVEKSG